ncbi:restriction endonuclease [Haloparvum sp. PAK95]|uniref:restriction endonuclease n=1 Tax=Haloparvum sp. PAK95 TaxID=3418962 RepID=UPI003D2EDBFF
MADTAEILQEKFSNISQGNPPYDTSIGRKLEDLSVDILNIVGHERDHIFVDIDLEIPPHTREELNEKFVRFSAIAAEHPASPPQVAITVVTQRMIPKEISEPTELDGLAAKYLLNCDVTSRAEYTVLLTENAIAILGNEYPPKVYPLSDITKEHAKNIHDELKPPEEYPKGRSGKFPAGYHPNQARLTRWLFSDSDVTPEYQAEIDTKFFDLDIDEYSRMLYEAYSADSNQSKGNLLEEVTGYLFEGLNLVSVRDRNLRTKSGEIDLVLEYIGGESPNLFDYQSRFVLIECKNVGSSVSSKEVGHFEKKINKTENSLGILIAWNGISGQDSGEDAQRYVDTSECDIVVLTSDDLYRILDGESLYTIIDEKIYSLRFDL